MSSLQGHVLVASTELKDPNFFRTVVLLIRHNDEGAFGLVLNRATETRIGDVWNKVRDTPCESDERLRLGGPVQGPLMALHAQSSLSEIEISSGVFFTANPDGLEQLVAQAAAKARYFVGYAGWGAGQLEAELAEGSWQTAKAEAEMIFDEFDDLWATIRKSIAQSTILSALKIRHVPKDPTLN